MGYSNYNKLPKQQKRRIYSNLKQKLSVQRYRHPNQSDNYQSND